LRRYGGICCLRDVLGWSLCDLDTRAAQLDGPLQVGRKGRLQPAQGGTVPMVVIEVMPDRSFTVYWAITGFCMVNLENIAELTGHHAPRDPTRSG
jgi:hypothetical protein